MSTSQTAIQEEPQSYWANEMFICPVDPTEKQYIQLSYNLKTAGVWVLILTPQEEKRDVLEIILNDLTKIKRVGFFCNEQEFSTVSASLLPSLVCDVNCTLKAPSFHKKWAPYSALRVKVETTGPTSLELGLGPVPDKDIDTETVAKIEDGYTVPTKVWRVYDMTPNSVLCISLSETAQPCAFYTNAPLQVETETLSVEKFVLHPGEIVTTEKLKEQLNVVGSNLIFTSFNGGVLNVEWQVPAYYKKGTVKFPLN